MTLGRAYLLNRLDGFVAGGVLDEASADRIREIVASELAAAPRTSAAGPLAPAPASPPVSVPAPAREAVPVRPVRPAVPAPVPTGPSFVETFFTPERAPSLLLYLGAFLVVVAALIFVNVSGQQVSDAVRLVLMVVGTLAFLAAGLVCHRIPRVEEAGRTFLVLGALLVPLDFGAYYALVAHVSPFTSPAMWLLGSVAAAALYAGLAIAGYGRVYSYFFFIASLSALAGGGVLLKLPTSWFLVPFAAYPLALQLAARLPGPHGVRLVAPLEQATRALLLVTLLVDIAPTIAVSIVSGLSFGERAAVPALALLGTAYFVARLDVDHPRERWLVVAGPAAILVAALFTIDAPLQTYGLISAVLATAYTIVREVGVFGSTPSPVPMWVRERSRYVAYALVAGAMLPLAAYWRAPAVGATAYLATAVLLGSLAAWRARSEKVAPDLFGQIAVGAAALHIGTALLLVATGLSRAGVAVFSGMDARAIALGFTPLAAGLGGLAAVTRRRLPSLADAVSVTSLASAALVVVFAFADPPLATVLATAAVAGSVASAFDSGAPRRLWIAAGFAAVAALSAGRWLQPPEELRPLALALMSILLFVPSYLPRLRANEFARVARLVAISAALAGVAVGLGFALGHPLSRLFDAPVWLATSPGFAVFGTIALVESVERRSERFALLATASYLASVLIVVARLHPAAVEAFTLPVAIYLGLAAWGIARFGSPSLRADLLLPAQIGAAVALLAPTYAWSWTQDAVTRTLVVLAESAVLLRFASARGLREVAAVAIGALGLVVLRASASPLALEATTAAFGAITIAFVLLIPRMPWRLPTVLREATEVIGVLLLLAPPLARATAFADDALAHGAGVLAAGAVVVGLGLWSGRRGLLGCAAAMLGLTGALALRDSARAEPFVAVTGIAILALVLATPRYLPRRLPAQYEMALEILAVGLIVSGGVERMLAAGAASAGGHAAGVLAESVALLAVGLAGARRALATAALATIALMAVWIMSDPTSRQLHGIVAGAALVAISLAAIRYAPKVLAERALVGAELLGAGMFLAPPLVASWSAPFVPGTLIVFGEIALLLAVGVVLRRRWLVAAALAALGLETIRASIDVVNRLPNWALFGGSGAILLTAGFILLIKREAWNAWSRRAYQWWAGL